MKKIFGLIFGGVFLVFVLTSFLVFLMKSPEFSRLFFSNSVGKVDTADIPDDCTKFFDGCNECDVQLPSKTLVGCTANQCDTLGDPGCILHRVDPNRKINMEKCAVYFDGCNECKIKDGKPVDCTKKECEVKQFPACKTYKELPTPMLADCTKFFDGCNTCEVWSGNIRNCTKNFCREPNMPICLEYRESLTCKRYFDGCNECVIENGKAIGCTENFCETLGTPKCIEEAPVVSGSGTI